MDITVIPAQIRKPSTTSLPEPFNPTTMHFQSIVVELKDYDDAPNIPEPSYLRHFLPTILHSLSPKNADPNSVSLIRETPVEVSSMFDPSTA